jgi:hypothetical protein
LGLLLYALFCSFAGAIELRDAPGPYPHGITTDGTNIWLTDNETKTVFKLDNEGKVLHSYPFRFGRPYGLVYVAGDLFVAEATSITRIDAETGAYVAEFPSPDTNSPSHQGLAYGDGKLWIVSRGSGPQIFGVDPATGRLLVSLPAPGDSPRGVTFHDGSLWNVDSVTEKIYRLSPVDGTVLAEHPSPLSNPRGLTYHQGAFLMTDVVVDQIARFQLTNAYCTAYVPESRYAVPGTSLWLPYLSSHPIDQTNAGIRRVLVMQHGTEDNAVDYFAQARAAARLAGEQEATLILSLQLLDVDKLSGAPPADLLYWTDSRFWGALSAGAGAPYPRSERVSSFEVLDRLLLELTSTAQRFANLQEIVISGHSGGGQFVNRYAAASKLESTPGLTQRGITMRYVVMNAGTYLYFDTQRFEPSTLDLAAGVVTFITPPSPVSGYNDYGYGLDHLYSYPAQTGRSGILAQYPARQLAYLIGEADTGSDNLDLSPEAMYQGTNRYERGRIYHEHLKQHFGTNQLPAHTFATITGVGHDAFEMISSLSGLRALFTASSGPGARPPPTVASFSPPSAYPSQRVTLNGTNFTGTSRVLFDGRPTQFAVSTQAAFADLQLTATVPSDATTGPITIETAHGNFTTSSNFMVLTLPKLTVRPLLRTNLVELSWRASSGFNVQRADTPLLTANWTTASLASSTLTNDIRYVTVSLGPGNRFFRLYKP